MFNFLRTKNKKPENLQEIVKQLDDLKKEINELSKNVDNLKKESKLCIQKIGIIRYNPFKEVGGDQSFSIALLDANNNGLVITGLFTRDGTRIYSKPIKSGLSEYILSLEEKEAIKKAINSDNQFL